MSWNHTSDYTAEWWWPLEGTKLCQRPGYYKSYIWPHHRMMVTAGGHEIVSVSMFVINHTSDNSAEWLWPLEGTKLCQCPGLLETINLTTPQNDGDRWRARNYVVSASGYYKSYISPHHRMIRMMGTAGGHEVVSVSLAVINHTSDHTTEWWQSLEGTE